jgi:hypothetical protein
MSRVVVFGAVAGRLAAASGHGGNGTGSKITQAEELPQELGSLGLQCSDIVRHKDFLSVPYIVCTYIDVQNYATKKRKPDGCHFQVVHPKRFGFWLGRSNSSNLID